MDKKIERSICELEGSLERIASLSAWRNLKIKEDWNSGPPSFRIYDPTEAEIMTEIGYFLEISSKIKIATAMLPMSKKKEIQGRLFLLEAQFNEILRAEKLKNI